MRYEFTCVVLMPPPIPCALIADRHCQFLAAFQQFEQMNVDEEVQEGVGLNVRPFRSPLGRKAAEVPNPQRRSYQVGLYARTYGVRGGVASNVLSLSSYIENSTKARFIRGACLHARQWSNR